MVWVTESTSRKIVFSAADVWRVARAVLSADFPGFSITVGRREAAGRFAGGGLGAGVMLVVADGDGYELDYGQRLLLEACVQDARDHGYFLPQGTFGQLCHRNLDPLVGTALPDDPGLPVFAVPVEEAHYKPELDAATVG